MTSPQAASVGQGNAASGSPSAALRSCPPLMPDSLHVIVGRLGIIHAQLDLRKQDSRHGRQAVQL